MKKSCQTFDVIVITPTQLFMILNKLTIFCNKMQIVLLLQILINSTYNKVILIKAIKSIATAQKQSGHGSDDNKGVLYIHQSITEALPSDCFVLNSGCWTA